MNYSFLQTIMSATSGHSDDPLAKFVPDLPHGEEITIHHLLTHTSGITGSMENLPGSNRTCRHFILWLSWHKCLRSRCWNCRQDRELHTRTRIMFCWHTLSKRSAANTSDRSCGTTSWRRETGKMPEARNTCK